MKKTNLEAPALDVMAIVFILLKLTGNVNWSWLMVLAPFWVGFSLTIIYWLVAELIKRSL